LRFIFFHCAAHVNDWLMRDIVLDEIRRSLVKLARLCDLPQNCLACACGIGRVRRNNLQLEKRRQKRECD